MPFLAAVVMLAVSSLATAALAKLGGWHDIGCSDRHATYQHQTQYRKAASKERRDYCRKHPRACRPNKPQRRKSPRPEEDPDRRVHPPEECRGDSVECLKERCRIRPGS